MANRRADCKVDLGNACDQYFHRFSSRRAEPLQCLLLVEVLRRFTVSFFVLLDRLVKFRVVVGGRRNVAVRFSFVDSKAVIGTNVFRQVYQRGEGAKVAARAINPQCLVVVFVEVVSWDVVRLFLNWPSTCGVFLRTSCVHVTISWVFRREIQVVLNIHAILFGNRHVMKWRFSYPFQCVECGCVS